LSGNVSGDAGLVLFATGGAGDSATLTGQNTYAGSTIVHRGLTLNGTQGNADITVEDGGTVDGNGTLGLRLVAHVADLIPLNGTAAFDATGLTLAPNLSGTQTADEYPITSRLTGFTGPFAQVVDSGPHTFEVDYDGTDIHPNAVVLMVTTVPEPGAGLLLVLGAAALWRWRRGR
jgi:hypothetical protein